MTLLEVFHQFCKYCLFYSYIDGIIHYYQESTSMKPHMDVSVLSYSLVEVTKWLWATLSLVHTVYKVAPCGFVACGYIASACVDGVLQSFMRLCRTVRHCSKRLCGQAFIRIITHLWDHVMYHHRRSWAQHKALLCLSEANITLQLPAFSLPSVYACWDVWTFCPGTVAPRHLPREPKKVKAQYHGMTVKEHRHLNIPH